MFTYRFFLRFWWKWLHKNISLLCINSPQVPFHKKPSVHGGQCGRSFTHGEDRDEHQTGTQEDRGRWWYAGRDRSSRRPRPRRGSS